MIREPNKRKLGAKAEQAVREYLSQHGIEIMEMNYRCRQGEVDVIARDDKYYVFIEVKYRNSNRYGSPQEAVGLAKQRRISKAAYYYLYSHGLGENTPVRFDVAAVLEDKITYIKNAFDYVVQM
jgi:putative endonuclease